MDPKKVEVKSVVSTGPKDGRHGIVLPLGIGLLRVNDVYFKIQESFLNAKTCEPTFTLRINLPNDLEKAFTKIEKAIAKLAMSEEENVEEFVKNFDLENSRLQRVNEKSAKSILANTTKYNETSFQLVRHLDDDDEIWGTLYHEEKDYKISAPFFERYVKKGKNRKRGIENPNALVKKKLKGDVVISLKQIFLGKNKAITCVVDEVLVTEIVKKQSNFSDFSDDDSDSGEEKTCSKAQKKFIFSENEF